LNKQTKKLSLIILGGGVFERKKERKKERKNERKNEKDKLPFYVNFGFGSNFL
jgi:hypothetical protein